MDHVRNGTPVLRWLRSKDGGASLAARTAPETHVGNPPYMG